MAHSAKLPPEERGAIYDEATALLLAYPDPDVAFGIASEWYFREDGPLFKKAAVLTQMRGEVEEDAARQLITMALKKAKEKLFAIPLMSEVVSDAQSSSEERLQSSQDRIASGISSQTRNLHTFLFGYISSGEEKKARRLIVGPPLLANAVRLDGQDEPCESIHATLIDFVSNPADAVVDRNAANVAVQNIWDIIVALSPHDQLVASTSGDFKSLWEEIDYWAILGIPKMTISEVAETLHHSPKKIYTTLDKIESYFKQQFCSIWPEYAVHLSANQLATRIHWLSCRERTKAERANKPTRAECEAEIRRLLLPRLEEGFRQAGHTRDDADKAARHLLNAMLEEVRERDVADFEQRVEEALSNEITSELPDAHRTYERR
jgi:hypothetical protein